MMVETELIVDDGMTVLPGNTHESVALIGRAALDTVFIALNRRPRKWLMLFIDDKRVFYRSMERKSRGLKVLPVSL